MRFLPAICLVILAACRPAASVATPAPTEPPALTGSVQIDSPREGAIIYSEVLAISGPQDYGSVMDAVHTALPPRRIRRGQAPVRTAAQRRSSARAGTRARLPGRL